MDELGMKDILYYRITYSCLYARMVQLNIQYIVRGKYVVNIIIFMLFSMSSVYVGLYTQTHACTWNDFRMQNYGWIIFDNM